MMKQFFEQQMDYIFFFYGFAFILLASICFTMHREKTGPLPWIWLALFGFLHGINEWLHMLSLSLGDGRLFHLVRFGTALISFLFLFEFGRDGYSKLKRGGPGRWIYIPLVMLALPGALGGLSGLNASVRYVFVLTGGLWSALNLFHLSKVEKNTRQALFFSAVLMAAYSLSAGAVVPSSSFFPASVINYSNFTAISGIPIEIVRSVLLTAVATAFWKYCRQFRRLTLPVVLPEAAQKDRAHYGRQLAFIIIIVLTFGWVLTELVGRGAYLQESMEIRRLVTISTTLLFSLLIVGFFVVRQRLWESAQLISANEKILSDAQEIAHLGSWTYDTGKDRLVWSAEMFRIYGLKPSGDTPSFSEQQLYTHQEDRQKVDEAVRRAVREGHEYELEFRIIRPDGAMRHVVQKITTMIGETGVQILGICQDITERKEAEESLRRLNEQLEYQATTDALTGIYNRMKFNELLELETQKASRYGTSLSLIMFDIDFFKRINDVYGHQAGDFILKETTKLVSENIRAYDIFARWGGEEFMILTPNTGLKNASQLAEKLRLLIGQSRQCCPETVTCSFGLTEFKSDDTVDSFVKRTDDALYKAKQNGRNKVEAGA